MASGASATAKQKKITVPSLGVEHSGGIDKSVKDSKAPRKASLTLLTNHPIEVGMGIPRLTWMKRWIGSTARIGIHQFRMGTSRGSPIKSHWAAIEWKSGIVAELMQSRVSFRGNNPQRLPIRARSCSISDQPILGRFWLGSCSRGCAKSLRMLRTCETHIDLRTFDQNTFRCCSRSKRTERIETMPDRGELHSQSYSIAPKTTSE